MGIFERHCEQKSVLEFLNQYVSKPALEFRRYCGDMLKPAFLPHCPCTEFNVTPKKGSVSGLTLMLGKTYGLGTELDTVVTPRLTQICNPNVSAKFQRNGWPIRLQEIYERKLGPWRLVT